MIKKFKPKQCICCGEYFTVNSPVHKSCELCKPILRSRSNAEFAKAWRKNNSDRFKETQRKYYEANKSKTYEYRRKWALENKGKTNAYSTKYRKANLDYYAKKRAERVAALKQAIPKWIDDVEVQYIYSLAKRRKLEVDHIVPLTSDLVCGLHVQDNMRCIPSRLNQKKGNRDWPDMWQ